MPNDNFKVWVITINGKKYVYYSDGKRVRYMGPLVAVAKAAEALAAELPVRRGITMNAKVEEWRSRVVSAVEGRLNARKVASAVALEMLLYGRSKIMLYIWKALRRKTVAMRIRARMRKLLEELSDANAVEYE